MCRRLGQAAHVFKKLSPSITFANDVQTIVPGIKGLPCYCNTLQIASSPRHVDQEDSYLPKRNTSALSNVTTLTNLRNECRFSLLNPQVYPKSGNSRHPVERKIRQLNSKKQITFLFYSMPHIKRKYTWCDSIQSHKNGWTLKKNTLLHY